MKKLLSFILLALTFSAIADGDLQQELNAIYSKLGKNANAGMIVTDPKTGQILFSKRADYLYQPASVQKLFTTSAALIELGNDFVFTTELRTNGSVTNHVLNGNLVVKFSGDPSLKSADLIALLDQLQKLGVQTINGNIILDLSEYDSVPYPPGWLWGDLTYGYAAPVGALILDRNKFAMQFIPGALGQHPEIHPDLPAGVIQVDNDTITTSHNQQYCPLTIYSGYDNHYRIEGCLDKHWGPQVRTLALRDPTALAGALIKMTFQKDGIRYTGKLYGVEQTPAEAKVLATHNSEPLVAIVKELLKKSDNLTTDTLLKKVGEQVFHQQGNWENGLTAVKQILGPRTGINFTQNLLNDGAGLSRYNLLSPVQLVKLLNYDYSNPALRDVLFQTLPIAGVDGTLHWRMTNPDVRGRVHAKTGSMTGVTALAGYVQTRDRGVLTFAMIVNGFVGKDYAYNHLEDQTCAFLANYRGRWA